MTQPRRLAPFMTAALLFGGACFSPPPASSGQSGTEEDNDSDASSEGVPNSTTDRVGDSTTGDDGPASTSSSTASNAETSSVDSSTTRAETTIADPNGSSTNGSSEGSTGPIDESRTVFLRPLAGAPMTYNGVEGADALCQLAADVADLQGTYMAWLSSSPQTAVALRFSQEGGPFVRPDGVAIAQDWNDLTDGSLEAPILLDAAGFEYAPEAQPETRVVTHTNSDGSYAGVLSPCNGYMSDTPIEPFAADAASTTESWTASTDGWACDNALGGGGPSLYCFQQ